MTSRWGACVFVAVLLWACVTFREHPAGGTVAFLFIEPPGHQAPPAP